MHITILSSLTALLGGTLTLGNILLPVKIGHWEAANGIKRRELDRLSDCHPRPETELMYGLNQDEDSVLFGKVSLDAPLGMPIVLLERCESLISHVDCSVDGHISVTFRSAEAFLRVSRAWNFVNDEIDHKFLLIINHDECGSADDRHPYIITSTEEDFKGRTSRLRSALVRWEDVAHSYVASFGEVKKKRPTIDRRQLDVFGLPLFTTPPMMTDYPEIVDRKITNTDPIIIDFRTPKGKKQSMFKSPLGFYEFFCTDCLFHASIKLSGSIYKYGDEIKACTLTSSFSNLQASATLSLVSKGKNSAEQVGGDHDLLSGGIPGAGIVIGKFLKLGGTWAYQLGLHGTFQGALNLGVTFQAGMKDMSALLTLDGVKPMSSFAKGWDKFKFPEPQYQLRQVEHNTEMSAVAQASIEFGVEAIKVGELHLKVAIPLPELLIKFNVGEAQGGYCKKGGADAGLYTVTKASFKLVANAEWRVGDVTKPLGEIPNLPSKEIELTRGCVKVSGESNEPLPPGEKIAPGEKPPPPKPKQDKECTGKTGSDGSCISSDFTGDENSDLYGSNQTPNDETATTFIASNPDSQSTTPSSEDLTTNSAADLKTLNEIAKPSVGSLTNPADHLETTSNAVSTAQAPSLVTNDFLTIGLAKNEDFSHTEDPNTIAENTSTGPEDGYQSQSPTEYPNIVTENASRNLNDGSQTLSQGTSGSGAQDTSLFSLTGDQGASQDGKSPVVRRQQLDNPYPARWIQPKHRTRV